MLSDTGQAVTGLLALDLDGTILLAGETLVPGIHEEIRAWRAGGWRVAIITARHHKIPLIDDLGVDAYTRDYGALVFADGQEIRRQTMTAEVVTQALNAVPEKARLMVLTPDLSFVNTPRWPSDRPLRRWPGGRDFVKLLLEHPDVSAVERAAAIWATLPDVTVIWERPTACMLVATGADKGSALHTIARHFQIPLNRTVAAGDGFSDAAMLRRAEQFLIVGRNPALRAGYAFVEQPADVPEQLALLRREWQGY